LRFLLDTQLLLWIAGHPERLPGEVRIELSDAANRFAFSAASLWEISIKAALGRDDFQVNSRELRREFLENGYVELSITGKHAVSIDSLPPIHKDPFDRILITQAIAEDMILLTADAQLARYPGPVRKV